MRREGSVWDSQKGCGGFVWWYPEKCLEEQDQRGLKSAGLEITWFFLKEALPFDFVRGEHI